MGDTLKLLNGEDIQTLTKVFHSDFVYDADVPKKPIQIHFYFRDVSLVDYYYAVIATVTSIAPGSNSNFMTLYIGMNAGIYRITFGRSGYISFASYSVTKLS